MRHAYLILAHNEPKVLRTLLRMIDDVRNDVFLHIDAKSDLAVFGELKMRHSRLVLLPRMSIVWGSASQMRVELMAFRVAKETGAYGRYHLISGVDLPLHSQDYLHDFCDRLHSDREFVGFSSADLDTPAWRAQWEYRFFFADQVRNPNILLRKTYSFLRQALISVQRTLGLRQKFWGELKKGTNWVSVTGSFVEWLIAHADEIEKQFRFVFCSDEKFLHTAIWNSPFRDKIFDTASEMRGAMREIDWQRGLPYVWRMVDIPKLMASDRLFARKFSESTDASVIAELERRIK